MEHRNFKCLQLSIKLALSKMSLEVEMKGLPGTVALYDVIGIGDPYNVRLPAKDETLMTLATGIDVRVYRMSQKIVTGEGIAGHITNVSSSAALVLLAEPLEPWENIRMEILSEGGEPSRQEIYAKVVSIDILGDSFQATARFTSVSPEARAVLKKASRGTVQGRSPS